MPLRAIAGFLFVSALATVLVPPAHAELTNNAEMEQVCLAWLAHRAGQPGGWDGITDPAQLSIAGFDDINVFIGTATAPTRAARCFHIAPRGWVVVPVLKELPPVKAYSEKQAFRVEQLDDHFGWPALLRDVLQDRLTLFVEEYGSLAHAQPSGGILGDRNRRAWDLVLNPPPQPPHNPSPVIEPLLTTEWDQHDPFNDDCPLGYNNDRCLAGCQPLATAQIMNYWEWPRYGQDDHTYDWSGDDSCNGNVGGGDLSADFTDVFDWDNIPDTSDCTSTEAAAVADLCYRVGVAQEADYGACSTSAFLSDALSALRDFFRYSRDAHIIRRNQQSSDDVWCYNIKLDVAYGRPVLYCFDTGGTTGHATVCDGYRNNPQNGIFEFHINYGWGGTNDGWYALDEIPNSVGSDSAIINIVKSRYYIVNADGSGDFATIAEAIAEVPDHPDGVTIALGDGTFTGPDNRNLDFGGKKITIKSRWSRPFDCVIDCEYSGRAFTFQSGEGSGCRIQNITIRNGYVSSGGGGAILCTNGSPTITGCRIIGNYCSENGGGVCATGGSKPALTWCVITGNRAGGNGGAIYYADANKPTIKYCTIAANWAEYAGGIFFHDTDVWFEHKVHRTIVWGNGADYINGSEIYLEGSSSIWFSCCDIDVTGTWNISPDVWTYGNNIDADPQFVDQLPSSSAPTTGGDYHILDTSPCTETLSPCAELIGALGVSGSIPGITIQGLIDDASEDDVVIVPDGLYVGSGNFELDFHGKTITLRSASGNPETCVIDCGGAGRGFNLNHVSSDVVIEGFTIQNGYADYGGGIFCADASPTIRNCMIIDSSAEVAGGGLYCSNGAPTLINCVLADNVAPDGAGMYASNAFPTLINCTITGNVAEFAGGGLYDAQGSTVLYNSILWDDTPDEIFVDMADPVVAYCDVQGGYLGDGNIDADPQFLDPFGNDYHLAPGSPCIDTADPDGHYAGETDIDGEMRAWDGDDDGEPDADMGCDEYGSGLLGDLTCDGFINGFDIDPFIMLIGGDLATYYANYPNCNHLAADLNGDGVVNGFDIDPFITLLGGG